MTTERSVVIFQSRYSWFTVYVLNNKLTYKFKVGKYLDTYTPSLFVKNFILPKEREEGIAVEN